MPSIEELLKKGAKKKFVKTSYRPYDYDLKHREEQAKKATKDTESEKTVEKNPVKDKGIEPVKQKSTAKKEPLKVENKVIEEAKPVKKEEVKQEKISVEVGAEFKDYPLKLQGSVLKKREIQNLVGVQKKIFFTIFNACVKEGALSTISFTAKSFEKVTSSSLGTVKSALNRLFKKDLLLRLEGKRAKGGYLYIGFDKEVWDICMQMVNEDRTLVE